MAVASKERAVRKGKFEELKGKIKASSNGEYLGELLTWSCKSDEQHKHKDVLDALTFAGLDTAVARKLLPRFAFSRATKKMTEDQVIDVVRDGQEEIKFQFSKKHLSNEEWEYRKDTTLKLNKVTGVITCPKRELQSLAQRLLDEAIEARTTTDITMIVQALFEKHGDLFSIRDQGGVYFVPREYTAFIGKIEAFINKLGGKLNRLEIPAASERSKESVKDFVADAMHNLIKDHETAIDGFTINTRSDTMQNAAERIKRTQIKIEAYADYLKDKSDYLLLEVEAAREKLRAKIESVGEEKENAPEGPKSMFGHSVSNILKWMGKEGWNYKEAKKVLDERGFTLTDTTIRGQLWCGKSGREQYVKETPELTPVQAKELEKARGAK